MICIIIANIAILVVIVIIIIIITQTGMNFRWIQFESELLNRREIDTLQGIWIDKDSPLPLHIYLTEQHYILQSFIVSSFIYSLILIANLRRTQYFIFTTAANIIVAGNTPVPREEPQEHPQVVLQTFLFMASCHKSSLCHINICNRIMLMLSYVHRCFFLSFDWLGYENWRHILMVTLWPTCVFRDAF